MFTKPSGIRVLMFGWEFPPFNSGGLGVACMGLTRSLVKQGIEIIFVLPRKVDIEEKFLKVIFALEGKLKIREINSGLYAYATPRNYKNKLYRLGRNQYGSSLFDEVLRYAEAAGQIAREEHFDLIHAHDWLSFPAGMEAQKASQKPFIAHVHATEYDRTGGNTINQDVYDIEREGMHASDAVISVSNFTKQTITQKYGVEPDKVRVIHNGVDDVADTSGNIAENLDRLKRKYKIVLFVGRLTLQKGPDYFIKMAKKVLEYEKNVLFLITGSGEMKERLIRDALSLGIADKVIFTGFLRGEKLKKVYRAADLLVMPSVSEPFGITALESLTNGSPVLVSKQSGVSEVVLHALKADFWDVDELANKVVSVLRHNSLKSTLSENGFREVQNLNWDEAAKKCTTLYRELLHN